MKHKKATNLQIREGETWFNKWLFYFAKTHFYYYISIFISSTAPNALFYILQLFLPPESYYFLLLQLYNFSSKTNEVLSYLRMPE